MDCRTALLTILDQVDYLAGNCRPNEMVGAILPRSVIENARTALSNVDIPIPLDINGSPHHVVRIEYLPRPKEMHTERIPIVYVEEIHERSAKKN